MTGKYTWEMMIMKESRIKFKVMMCIVKSFFYNRLIESLFSKNDLLIHPSFKVYRVQCPQTIEK